MGRSSASTADGSSLGRRLRDRARGPVADHPGDDRRAAEPDLARAVQPLLANRDLPGLLGQGTSSGRPITDFAAWEQGASEPREVGSRLSATSVWDAADPLKALSQERENPTRVFLLNPRFAATSDFGARQGPFGSILKNVRLAQRSANESAGASGRRRRGGGELVASQTLRDRRGRRCDHRRPDRPATEASPDRRRRIVRPARADGPDEPSFDAPDADGRQRRQSDSELRERSRPRHRPRPVPATRAKFHESRDGESGEARAERPSCPILVMRT